MVGIKTLGDFAGRQWPKLNTTFSNFLMLNKLLLKHNYSSVLEKGSKSDWQYHAALGVLSNHAIDQELLFEQADPNSKIYLAAHYWMNHEDEKALAVLSELKTTSSEKFQTLIKKEKIHILGQFPASWSEDIASDNKFSLSNIDQLQHREKGDAYTSIHEFYEEKNSPDFYICHGIEDYEIPLNVSNLPCPTFASCRSIDRHFQHLLPWLNEFDALLCTSNKEIEKYSSLGVRSAFCYPKLFGFDQCDETIKTDNLEYDLLIIAPSLIPYQQKRIDQLLKFLDKIEYKVKVIPDCKLEISEHLPKARVISTEFVSESDFPKWATLISQYSNKRLLTKKGSLAQKILAETDLLIYRDASELKQLLIENQKQSGAKKTNLLEEEISKFFRFLTFIASDNSYQAEKNHKAKLYHRDLTFYKEGDLRKEKRTARRVKNLAEAGESFVEGETQPLKEAARGMLFEFGRAVYPPAIRKLDSVSLETEYYQIADELMLQALRRTPDCLITNFNSIRIRIHLGTPNQLTETIAKAKQILSEPMMEWRIDLDQDIYPYDFFGYHFNYHDYFETLLEAKTSGKNFDEQLKKYIFASLCFYVGHYEDPLKFFNAAAILDSNFLYYKYRLAKALAEAHRFDEAEKLLESLKSSYLSFEVSDLFSEISRINHKEYHSTERTLLEPLREYENREIIMTKAPTIIFKEDTTGVIRC